jgi:hypothetical protein
LLPDFLSRDQRERSLGGCGGAGTRGYDHWLRGQGCFVVGPHERVSHRVATGRRVELEEDTVDPNGLQVWANGSGG